MILDKIERSAVDLVAKIAPWAAPIPTAYLIGRATINHLAWPAPVAITAALIIETLGLASAATALELFEFNQVRRKTDSPAPFALAVGLVLAYFTIATGLTVALDIYPALARYAPAIFPALSLTGITILALRADHRRRLQGIADERAERKETRRQVAQNKRTKTAQAPALVKPVSAQKTANHGDLSAANRTKQKRREQLIDALLGAYLDNPDLGATEAARLLGVHRNTVYNYSGALVEAGRLSKNGAGWVVVAD